MNMMMHDGVIKQEVAWIGRLKITCTFFRRCSWLVVRGGGGGGGKCRIYGSVRLREHYECNYVA